MSEKLLRVFLLGMLLCGRECRAQTESSSATQAQRVKNWISRQDKDNDGKISRDEALGLIKAGFDRIDADKSGFIERKELERVAARLGGRGNRRNNQQAMSTEQLLKSLPEGVVAEADVAYRPGESKAWRLDLVRPEKDGAVPRPAIVFIHGGGWRSGDKRRGYFIKGAIEYAQKGYVCASINYRLVEEAKFPACIEDVKCAVRWLRANAKKYNVDPQRIGGYGNSAGAHLVAMLGLAGPDAKLEGDGPYRDQSSMLQAVCCSATPTDFSLFGQIGNRRAGIFSGPKEMIEQQMRQASPITYAGKQAPPFLVIHGTADKTVDVKHGDTFVKALQDAGAESVEYLRVDGAGHGVFGQHAAKTHAAMEKFFAQHLQASSLGSGKE